MIFLQQESPTMAKDVSEDFSSCAVVTDSGEVGKWNRGVCVGPENTRNKDTDFHAFSLSPEEELYLEFIPNSVAKKLVDKTNWNDRLWAIGEIERILTQASSNAMSDSDLNSIVGLILTSVGDSQLAVSHKGVQVLEVLVQLVRKRILPHLAAISSKLLSRLGSNRRNMKIKGTIMSLFKALMDATGPMTVLNNVSNHGLQNKNSRIREESVNVVIIALLHYQNGEIRLLNVARDIVQSMQDSRARVRQAAFEAIALISSQLMESDLRRIISMVVEMHRSTLSSRSNAPQNGDVNLVDAFQARIARKLVPKLDNQELVQYSIHVLKPSVEVLYSGPDVDWISAGSGGSASMQLQVDSNSPPQPSSQSSQLSTVVPPPSSFRPYRSAGETALGNRHQARGKCKKGSIESTIVSMCACVVREGSKVCGDV